MARQWTSTSPLSQREGIAFLVQLDSQGIKELVLFPESFLSFHKRAFEEVLSVGIADALCSFFPSELLLAFHQNF